MKSGVSMLDLWSTEDHCMEHQRMTALLEMIKSAEPRCPLLHRIEYSAFDLSSKEDVTVQVMTNQQYWTYK